MKQIFVSLTIFTILLTPVTVMAANQVTISKTDRKLADLNNRFAAIESTWGRFQTSGFLSLETRSRAQHNPLSLGTLEFDQDLNLSFDAYIDPNHQLSLKLAHQGGWGLNYQGPTNTAAPMATPLWIDEAFLRMKHPNSLNYLGRFKYSLGVNGLIADFLTYPVEGLAIQKEFGALHLIGLYSRINTTYQPETGQVASGEDYLAARIGWSEGRQIFGINLVPNGVTGEQNFSLDWSLNSTNQRTAVEIGWYSFHSDQYPDFQVDWTPGFIMSFERQFNKSDRYQVKLGYFSPKFTPSFSSLANVAGDTREWFLPNTQGVEFSTQNRLTKVLDLENRLIILMPIEATHSTDPGYHWRGALVHNYSPFNHLQFGIESWYFPENKNNQLFLNWSFQF